MAVSPEVATLLDDLAEGEGVTRIEIIRRAIAVMKAFSIAHSRGLRHVGFTADPNALDHEITGILNSSRQA